MRVNKKFIIYGLLFIVALIFWQQKQILPKPAVVAEGLKIVSTKPELDNATILANQTLEFNFNKSFDTGRIKFRLDPPETDLIISTKEQTVTLTFKKPLKLGSGYTLFIYSDPANTEKIMDSEYVYHFQTIGYRGI